MLYVMCHVLGVMCHESNVKQNQNNSIYYLFVCLCNQLVELDGGGSVTNKAYLVNFKKINEHFCDRLVELAGEGSLISGAFPVYLIGSLKVGL